MYVPDKIWRCTEDLKVILITNEGKLTRNLAMTFYNRFGKVKSFYLLNQDKIACGMFETEEEAEEALKEKEFVLQGGMKCDVTTFKSGNRKVYISPLDVPDEPLRAYFESNYGEILRIEKLNGNTAAFILFLKVDDAVACRNKHHCINGVNMYVRPGCAPGTDHQPDRSTMYQRPTMILSPFRGPNSFEYHYSSSARSDTDISRLITWYPQVREILDELRDLSIVEIDGMKKRKKKDVNVDAMVIDWINSHLNKNGPIRRGAQIIVESSNEDEKEEEETETVIEGEEEGEAVNKRLTQALRFKSPFRPTEKELRWEERRKELNLPPTDKSAHYAIDEEGFPIFHNGKYIRSIFKGGRFIYKRDYHVTFDMEKNDVRLFKRSEEEYQFLGRTPKKIKKEKSVAIKKEKSVEIKKEKSVENGSTSKDPSHSPPWPFAFPMQPPHLPLMQSSTYEDSSLDVPTAKRYIGHLKDKWMNTRHAKFFHELGYFLKPLSRCDHCNVNLIEPMKQFEHIFSRPHLECLNRNNIKYTASDFTFWNNLLVEHFGTGKITPRGRDIR